MSPSEIKPTVPPDPDLETQAAGQLLKRRAGSWTAADERQHAELVEDPDFADASGRVERVWDGVAQQSNRPEFLSLREQALARARRSNQRRWSLPWTTAQRSWTAAASLLAVCVAVAALWQLSPYGYRPGVYETGIGEQRSIELADHSHIALDSSTKIRATLTADARTIDIAQGQAQFNVAHDATRPFKVIAGGHTIVAVGTVFTVEYADQTVHVAMMEGKVAVLSQETADGGDPQGSVNSGSPNGNVSSPSGAAPNTIELVAGEELRFARDGHPTIKPKADIEAATAWREGKVIFRSEPLGEAVRRLNRYSRTKLQLDGAELSNLSVSGVFDAGDSRAFADVVQSYLPVTADYSQADVIRLRMR
jgi:transmembrane sensor